MSQRLTMKAAATSKCRLRNADLKVKEGPSGPSLRVNCSKSSERANNYCCAGYFLSSFESATSLFSTDEVVLSSPETSFFRIFID